MSDVTLLTANLAVVVLESRLHGIYAILASCALYFMVSRYRERLSGTSWFSRSSLLCPVALGTSASCVSADSFSFSSLMASTGFSIAFHKIGRRSGARILYSNFFHITKVLKYGFLVASFFIGDSLLFRPGIILVPIITRSPVDEIYLTGLSCTSFGVGLTYQISMYTSNDSMFQAAYRRWTTAACICCLCTAAYTTGFIWYKLWIISRTLESFGVTSRSTIVRIFADSAGLFATFSLLHLVSYQCSNIQFIVLDCMPVVVGISNLLVQIRLHWDLTEKRAASARLATPQ
ncbi:hypothetical protein B0H13DRAFT_2048429 [Mycena leptocephala]|nr:hypothetical protein B0H13DRAFT_2048429 [Mycena leptocephala]